VTSSSWKDNAMVARKYGGKLASNPNCDGDNVSPQLSWSNAATKSYAIVMIDPDGGNGQGSVHWVAYDVPASKTSLKEGEVNAPSPNIVYGDAQNGMPNGVYRGPCPPHGQAPHHYVITVIATDLAPDALKPGLTRVRSWPRSRGTRSFPRAMSVVTPTRRRGKAMPARNATRRRRGRDV
jgi:Raf kinase inhibitor-like YbhB/YbcL family protein